MPERYEIPARLARIAPLAQEENVMKEIGWTLLIALTFLAQPAPAGAQQTPPCEVGFGGVYTFGHSGVKSDGNAFSAIATFTIRPDGSFDTKATINERGVGVYTLAYPNLPWYWIDWDCNLTLGGQMLGHVSNDGNFIAIATLNSEQTAGTAFRQ